MVNIKKLKYLSTDLSILYVEDDLAIAKSMQHYLEKIFKSVSMAYDGEEGLKLYKESQNFDIVIADLSMPKMSGTDMISAIKKINSKQSILITSAHSESGYLMDAMKAHVDGYVLKPFNYDDLNYELYKISEKLYKFKENENYKNYLQEILKKQTQEMSENYEKTLLSMVELIEQRDTYTAGHSKRVAEYCSLIAKEMAYSEQECKLIHQAGILHDIGKIETPDAVLLKPSKLNDLEYSLIQEHVTVGYKLLNKVPMFKALAPIVYEHHECYDGSGYPNGLVGDAINKYARIMIVADSFDAMTTNRIYKGRKSIQEALVELESLSGVQFHPEVVLSALEVLKNIKLDDKINQLPKTKLEEERFAYFYKDTITPVYNQHYLELMLHKNSSEFLYKYLMIFSLKNFSLYNKENSWDEGNSFLKEFAKILQIHLEKEIVFRVFGDDFVVLVKQTIETEGVQKALDKLVKQHHLTYRVKILDLSRESIEKLRDIELIY